MSNCSNVVRVFSVLICFISVGVLIGGIVLLTKPGRSTSGIVMLCVGTIAFALSCFILVIIKAMKDKERENIHTLERVENDNISMSSNTIEKKKEEENDMKEEKVKEIKNPIECLICESIKPLCIIIPCEHRIICYQCGEKLFLEKKTCPLCNNIIETIWPES